MTVVTLADEFPVLLGPVRIETRFTATELLVRVFPDDWAVDSFESKPTAAEIAAVDAYWAARWAAGGRPEALAAAWSQLSARVPTGRASWLLTLRPPKNPGEEPAGVSAATTVLVVVTATAVATQDRGPATTYWSAVWRAHGDRAKIRQADAALNTAAGARAGSIRAARPIGLDAAPLQTSDAVSVAFLVLEAFTDVAAQSWTQAAKANLLPDRFQVNGYIGGQQVVSVLGATVPAGLAVSPDPSATDQPTVDPKTGVLTVPANLLWLTDFTEAVKKGMGVRIPLTDQIRNGLDRLVVFGLRQGVSAQQSATDLGALITRQLRSSSGFGLLAQGTATNNTDQTEAGPDPTQEVEAVRRAAAAPSVTAAVDWRTRADGQRFADLLGLDPAVLTGVPGADLTDQRDARAANTALWPATWGSYLRTALHPVLTPAAIDQTRDFYLKYVSGRGPLPAIRIGRQPYGIVATTAFSRLTFANPHRVALNQILTAAGQDWQAAATTVTHLGRTGAPGTPPDPHQQLLDILALHPTSAEYYQRYAQSVEDVFNRENLGGLGPAVLTALDRLDLPGPLRALLTRFGHPDTSAAQDPDLLRRLFLDTQQPILAPLIDDRPLSETAPVRGYASGGRNYLSWLADAAAADLETVRLETGFDEDTPPAALLYVLLRHAVLLGWADAARNLAVAAGIADPRELAADPPFIHVSGRTGDSESRFRRLYSPARAVTGNDTQLLAAFIPSVMRQNPATAQLAEQVDALGLLEDLPTARLERVFAEHLDSATYRLDAWRLGLATERLSELRFGPDGTAAPKRGLHLGAYGWLEDVRPNREPLTPITLAEPLATVFKGSTPLLSDPSNQGFVHAPSPAQARTAAVLRAGYAANAGAQTPDAFAVNLSADRVRVALRLLDGLRQGQSLGALLGYELERGLHDRHAEAEVDAFIAGLRLRFPLRAGKLAETTPHQPVTIEQVEARNVVDGLALVRHVTRNDVPRTYPFGLEGQVPAANPDQTLVLSAEVLRLLDIHDALSDLAVAEGTHQALAGNTERATATLDAYAKDGFPPPPAVVETPRSGTTLTHRFALRLTPGLSPTQGPGSHPPRARAEPAVNDWLASVLPPAANVAVRVTWNDPNSHDPDDLVISQADLELAPIELLWSLRPAGEAALTDLDDRIIAAVRDRKDLRPDVELTIQYTQRIPGKVTLFELSSLVVALRTLLTTARPLRASDLAPAAGPAPVTGAADDDVAIARQRPAAVRTLLTNHGKDVATFLTDLGKLYPAPPAPVKQADVLKQIDTLLTRYGDLVGDAARFGMVRSGWGELMAWRAGVFTSVLAKVGNTVVRLSAALAAADAVLARYDALPTAATTAERLALLRQAERWISTQVAPVPPKFSDLRTTIGTKRKTFNTALQNYVKITTTKRTTLSALLADIAALPLAALDPVGLDLSDVQAQIVAFGRELIARAQALQTEVNERLAASATALTQYDQALTDPDRVAAALAALRALLGADVLVVPEFTPPSAVATSVHKARGDSDKLIAHLTKAPVKRDFPVEDWVHGLARVRDPLRLWEKVTVLSDAFGGPTGLFGLPLSGPATTLVPIQLPYQQNDHWLGLEFAAGASITEDRLLFTACYADPFNPLLPNQDNTQCGLVFDEWTEVIPAAQETTSIAVNVQRPDSEPPQAMLLVSPPSATRAGAWKLEDLLAAVNETLDLAKTRAVEPEHLDATGYAHLLPATLMSATAQPITISTDLSTVNARWKVSHD